MFTPDVYSSFLPLLNCPGYYSLANIYPGSTFIGETCKSSGLVYLGLFYMVTMFGGAISI